MAIVADGGDPMNTFREGDGREGDGPIALPLERVKHGNKPDGRYHPGEAGDSEAEALIKQVMMTWVDAANMPEAIPRVL